jgi:arylsulfatase A-like enzyme
MTNCSDLLLTLVLFTHPAPAAERPNVLVILADDFGCGDYSAFGTKDIRTPNIDRLFNEGIAFDNFFANSCVCSPTRAALLTGCYPDRVGVPGVIRDVPEDSWGYLAKEATLLPEVLKTAGYLTAIVGKWHLGYEAPNRPNDRGFDFFHGFLGDMMDDYYTHLRHGHNFMRRNLETVAPQGHATDVFTDWACEYLAERAKAKGEQPFFLYLAYNAPHGPVQPAQEWLEKVRRREPKMPDKRTRLVALIEHLDHGIGRVLETLDDVGLAEKTLVIFSSDNGGLLNEGANNGPWRSGKTHMYEGGLRVPFAARWPGHISPGTHSEQLALSMDIYPTVMASAGAATPDDLDGVNFLPQLLGEQASGRDREVYFVRREGGLAYGGKTIEALRQGDWKLVQDSPFAPLELYNLANDPEETSNLAAQERQKLQQLAAALRLHVQRGGQVPWQNKANATERP